MTLTRAELRWRPIEDLKRLQKLIQSELDDRMCQNFRQNTEAEVQAVKRAYRRTKKVY